MNRRSFFSKLGKALAGAALVTHLELGRLIPVLELVVEPLEYYAIQWPVVTRRWTFGTYVNDVLQYHSLTLSGKNL